MNNLINMPRSKGILTLEEKKLYSADLFTVLSKLKITEHKRRLENSNVEEPVIDIESIKEKKRINQEKIGKQDPFRKTVRKKVK